MAPSMTRCGRQLGKLRKHHLFLFFLPINFFFDKLNKLLRVVDFLIL